MRPHTPQSKGRQGLFPPSHGYVDQVRLARQRERTGKRRRTGRHSGGR
jgi:hypothetical protein